MMKTIISRILRLRGICSRAIMIRGTGSKSQSVIMCTDRVARPSWSWFRHRIVRGFGTLAMAWRVKYAGMGLQLKTAVSTHIGRRMRRKVRYVQWAICHFLEVIPVILLFCKTIEILMLNTTKFHIANVQCASYRFKSPSAVSYPAWLCYVPHKTKQIPNTCNRIYALQGNLLPRLRC